MKRRNDAWQVVVVVASIILLLTFMPRQGTEAPDAFRPSGLITLSLNPSAGTVTQGTQVRVDIVSSQSINLAGVQMTVAYNPSVLSFINVSEGPFLRSGGGSIIFLNTINTSVAGQIRDISIVRIGSGVNGTGTVASIYFNAIATGTSGISFTKLVLSDNLGNPISGAFNTTTTVTITSPPDNLPPSTVTGLVAQQVSTSQVNIAWNPATDNIGVVGYRIYRDGNLIGNTSLFLFQSNQLQPGTFYTYRVAAYDAAGNQGNLSAQAGAWTTLRGDLNGDQTVNIIDIQLVVQDFSSTSGFNPAVDLAAPFGSIDLFDVMAVVLDWGRSTT